MTHEDSKQVWRREDLAPHDKLVLLALADHTDKQSQCYSSKARLCRRTGMSARGVQVATKRLIGRRLLSVEVGAGRGGTNLYTLHLAPSEGVPSQEAPPASDAPRMECAPAQDVSTPRRTGRGGSRTGCSQTLIEPSRTVRRSLFSSPSAQNLSASLCSARGLGAFQQEHHRRSSPGLQRTGDQL